ncbi:cadherin-like beta sandwich domain-containing protein [uncultured Clostridium sp.]|uniref:cadherin-like beta sandwich domain-containing protein n=1 Tax=uncultured Clostridium sp. TaxID=59620 RepID=UPI0025FF0A4B|nr:cadherin-like beta sandwich domain-containing protein [uncultured Clostridium sp.]
MNKRIKRIVAMVLAVGAVSAVEPSKYVNIMSTEAYASSDIYLKSISVMDGDDITLTKTKKTYSTNVPNSTGIAYIRVITNNKDDVVTIDGHKMENSSNRKYKYEYPLEKGKNEVEIEVESEDGDDSRTYTLKIDRGGKQSDDEESVFLDMINVDYGEVEFEKEKTEYDLEVDEDVSEIRIQAKPEKSSTKVYIEGSKVTEDDKYRKSVKLYKGANAVTIDLEDEDDEDNTKKYTLNIYRGKNPNSNVTVDTSKFDTTQDEIYLDNLLVNDGELKISPNFNKKITSYTLDVQETTDSIIVKGDTEYDANIVKINGISADSKNRKRVQLTPGKNVIEVQVNNDVKSDDKDYEKRVYTLTVYRGISEGTSATNKTESAENTDKDKNEIAVDKNNSSNTNNSGNGNTIVKPSQWVNVMGKWQYNDVSGNPLKNTWFYDNSNGKTYYLQPDGNMAIGWIIYNGSWYYLDQSGAKQTGWQHLGSSWYYLDSEGKMQTGWFKDSDGKWYYLYDSGAMAANTIIDGYKLGSDGAWIK